MQKSIRRMSLLQGVTQLGPQKGKRTLQRLPTLLTPLTYQCVFPYWACSSMEQLTVVTILPRKCSTSEFTGIPQLGAHLSISRGSSNIYFSIEAAPVKTKRLDYLRNKSSVRIASHDFLLPSPYSKSEWSLTVQIGLAVISIGQNHHLSADSFVSGFDYADMAPFLQ